MKKILPSLFIFTICFTQNIFAQNGTCIPAIALDCVTAPKYIDSVWTTNAIMNFSNNGTNCNTQDQNYIDYQNKLVEEYCTDSFHLHIGLNPSSSAFIGVWIDWNNDQVFGSGEQVYLSSAPLISTNISVNVSCMQLDTVIMRVRSGVPLTGPCDSANAGETEDYRLLGLPVMGVSSLTENSSWTISPNPAGNFITVNFPENSSFEKIEVVDMLGNVLYYNTTSAERADIDLSALPHGMYFMKITSGGKSSVKKFVH